MRIIPKGEDGFYHPTTEKEIIDLIIHARENDLLIRCRGAAHSVSWAIYTDEKGIPETVSVETPPISKNLNIMFDQYSELHWVDESKGIVEVEAGAHLGLDPNDPTHTSTLQNSLLYQAFQKGWTLNDVGGITHQTVSGCLMTGTSGGTLQYSLDNNILAFRVVDGNGKIAWIEKKKDSDLFNAFGISMGLLGVVTKVRLQLVENFDVFGSEETTPVTGPDAPINLFGADGEKKPSLKEFLQETPYSRILWWPQKSLERMIIWKAKRGHLKKDEKPKPYFEFSDKKWLTLLEEYFAALLFTLVGNKGFFPVLGKVGTYFSVFYAQLCQLWGQSIGSFLAAIVALIPTILVIIISFLLVLIFSVFPSLLSWAYPKIVNAIEPITKPGQEKVFRDHAWRSLPMDNAANDILLGTEFTEIWIPLEYTQKTMQVLNEHFTKTGYTGTGYYSTELYASQKSNFWLSPAYQQDVFRVDVFWYLGNAGNPALKEGFYAQFWNLLRQHEIPFRLHWAKFLPEYDYKDWGDYFKSQYPKWDDFMELRKQRDPKNIFLTDYWKRHLVI